MRKIKPVERNCLIACLGIIIGTPLLCILLGFVLLKYNNHRINAIATETVVMNNTAEYLIDFSDVLGPEWQRGYSLEERDFRKGIYDFDTRTTRGTAIRAFGHPDLRYAAVQQVTRSTSSEQAEETFTRIRSYLTGQGGTDPSEWEWLTIQNRTLLQADRVASYLHHSIYYVLLLYQDYIVYLQIPSSYQDTTVVTLNDLTRVIAEVDRKFRTIQ